MNSDFVHIDSVEDLYSVWAEAVEDVTEGDWQLFQQLVVDLRRRGGAAFVSRNELLARYASRVRTADMRAVVEVAGAALNSDFPAEGECDGLST